MSRFQVTVPSPVATAAIVSVDGLDLSRYCSHVHIELQAGRRNVVYLGLEPMAMAKSRLEADVVLHEDVVTFLVNLGWTPPQAEEGAAGPRPAGGPTDPSPSGGAEVTNPHA